MSDTPRTDEQAFITYIAGEGESVVDADFARILERNYNRVIKEQRESFEHFKEAQAQFREGTWYGHTTSDYKESISGTDEGAAMFSLAYQWQDKKHRHVFDLCNWIDKLQDELKESRSEVDRLNRMAIDLGAAMTVDYAEAFATYEWTKH